MIVGIYKGWQRGQVGTIDNLSAVGILLGSNATDAVFVDANVGNVVVQEYVLN
jgi:hypothetical protein